MKRAARAMLGVLLLIASSSAAVAAEDDAADQSSAFDYEAFGRLPILFNGRVTDWDHYARGALLRISGRETWPDREGDPQPAVCCLLDLMSGAEALRATPILLVEAAAAQELLMLEPAAEHRYAMNDVVPRLEAFEQRLSEISASSSKPTADELAVLAVSSRLLALGRLLELFQAPDLTSGESILASLRRSQELESQAIPLVVPPAQAADEWTTLTRALIMTDTQAETGLEANPAGEHFIKLIAAYRESDAATFNQATRDFATHITENCLASCPLRFEAPQGWFEEGTPRLRQPYYFNDTRAFGMTVSTLTFLDGPDQLKLNVNFFPRGAASQERIVNSWRQSLGLAPAPFEKIKTKPVQVSGQAGWRVDVESPPGAPGRSHRTVAVGFSQGEQTWVIACSGPGSLLAKQVAGFDAFVESLAVSDAAEAEAWFALAEPEPLTVPAGAKIVLAVIPDKSAAWVLQAAYFAEDEPDEQVRRLRSLLKSIQFPSASAGKQPAGKPPFRWKLPQGWVLRASPEGQLSIVCGDQSELTLDIQSLVVEDALPLPLLVNQWRAGYQLPELSPEEIQASLEKLTIGGRTIVLMVSELP